MKKETKEKISQMKERMKAYRRGLREDEIQDHNGKPFTSPQLSETKKDKEEKLNKRLKHQLKQQDFDY